MKSDINGKSTCLPGQENYESFNYSPHRHSKNSREMVQYDYRTPSGKLFSTIAPTLEDCRKRRDQWIANGCQD